MDSSIIIIISLKIYMFAKLKKLITINSIAADKTGKTLDVRLEEIKKEAKMEALKAENYVGKVRFQFNSENPADLLGFGTWVLESKGRVPVGFDPDDNDFNEVGKTAGEKTHTLDLKELPGDVIGGTTNKKNWAACAWGDYSGSAYPVTSLNNDGNEVTKGISNQPHNNMQPYITMYIYRRIV